MIYSFRRSALLLSVALIALSACDSETPPAQKESQIAPDPFSFFQAMPPRPSWAGTYLASRAAQERFDWERAEHFLSESQKLKPITGTAPDRRLMLLAIGSGDVATAIELAKKQSLTDDPSGLTALILALEPLRDDQLIAATNLIEDLPATALAAYAKPLLQAWIRAETGTFDLVALPREPGYLYHRVLLADHMNQIDAVASPALLLQGKNQITALSAERMGDIFLRHKKFDLAASLYKIATALNPHAPGIKARIAAAESQAADVSSLALAPPVHDARTGIALVFFDMASTFYNDRGDESAQVFTHMALALDPDLIEAKLLLANILSRNDRLDAAIKIYQTIPASYPRYQAVQQQIAALYVTSGQDEDAIETLQALLARAAAPQDKVDILLQIGDLHRNDEKFAAALTAYDQAMSLLKNAPGAENWDLLYARGMTLERLERWPEAEKDLLAALSFEPDHPYLLNYLGYSWTDQGTNLPRAMEMLKKAVSILPDDGYITDSVGWAYYRQGDYTQAAAYLERAVELLPYDPTVNDHLGDIYWKIGRTREAKFQWHRAYNYSKDDKEKEKIKGKLESGL